MSECVEERRSVEGSGDQTLGTEGPVDWKAATREDTPLWTAPARRTEGNNTFNVIFLDIHTVQYISYKRNQNYNLHLFV